MKTIYQLKEEIEKWKPSAKYSPDSYQHLKIIESQIRALKDVLKLIDKIFPELPNNNQAMFNLKDNLKKEIKGE